MPCTPKRCLTGDYVLRITFILSISPILHLIVYIDIHIDLINSSCFVAGYPPPLEMGISSHYMIYTVWLKTSYFYH